MQAADEGETINTYRFNICGTADEILPELIQGNIDIALIPPTPPLLSTTRPEVPSNHRYQHTGRALRGDGDESINEIADLEGRTVLMTGKGTTPEYVMNYLLDMAGIADKVTLEYKSEATEVAAALNASPDAIGVLPQPYACRVPKNDALRLRISLTEAWDSIDEGGPNGQLVTGVLWSAREFAEANPRRLPSFWKCTPPLWKRSLLTPRLQASWSWITESWTTLRPLPGAPACNLVCITGAEMKDALISYLSILADSDPAGVGGELPGDDFYYMD